MQLLKEINKKQILALFIFTIFNFPYLNAQIYCGTELSQEHLNFMNEHSENVSNTDNNQFNFDNNTVNFSVVVHIINNSAGDGGISENEVKSDINFLNDQFSQVNFQFNLCEIKEINNTNYFTELEKSKVSGSEEFEMANTGFVENSINIFYVPNPISGKISVCGWSSFPSYVELYQKDWLVIKNSCANNGSTLVHEMGHYFNLYHTHESFSGTRYELVDRSNCGPGIGDELCDTPADPTGLPWSNGVTYILRLCVDDQTCQFNGNTQFGCGLIKDVNGDLYKPDPDNLMSYSDKICRVAISPQQITRMQEIANLFRTYLSTNCDSSVDLAMSSCGGGNISTQQINLMDVIVENKGNLISEATELTLHFSKDAILSTDDYLISTYQVGSILSGSSKSFNVNEDISKISPPLPEGTYHIIFSLDVKNEIEESDETNNTCSTNTFTVSYGCTDNSAHNYSNSYTYIDNSTCETCTDGIQNGNEAGIDCGGSCANACGYNACRFEDWTALKALYESTNGDNWTNRDGWDTMIDELSIPQTNCNLKNLFGVELDDLGYVSKLDLSRNQLTGNIPAKLGNLAGLAYLKLYNNQLVGGIPLELGDLNKLTYLDLYTNQLSGNIPAELGNLSKLADLRLTDNQLTGNIPAELGNLSNLVYLRLDKNQLIGSIPAELGNLINLKSLLLESNQLTGNIPSELGGSINLVNINLSSNKLNGSIPAELGNLSKLGYLHLSNNQLTGTIPVQLGNLSQLNQLSISSNEITGSIIVELGNLANLTYLDLTGNELVGNIPPELGNLSKLKKMYLSKNKLSGNIPGELGNLSSLTLIELNDNKLNGCYPASVYSFCTQLTDWNFNGNFDISKGNNFDVSWEDFCLSGASACDPYKNCHASDWIALKALYESTNGGNWINREGWNTIIDGQNNPSPNCNLNNLFGVKLNDAGYVNSLDLKRNQLSGIIPSELCNLSNLANLRLDVNQLDGNIPAELGNLSNLMDLRLSFNQLTGSIPAELGNLSKLRKLFLSSNQLTGSIPSQLGDLSLLVRLYLNSNQLTGSIPAELGNLGKLVFLNLNENELDGSIPAELGNLSKLAYLYLGNNQLNGNLPVELSNLSKLNQLAISNNKITGSILAELGSNTNLTYLNLGGNQLAGNIPPELGNLSKLTKLYLSKNQLSGNIPAALGNLSSLTLLEINNNSLTGCYSASINSFCTQLTDSKFKGNASISEGNNFDASWEDFCSNGSGLCDTTNCHIDDWTALKALYESTNGDNWTNNTGWELIKEMAPPLDCDLQNLYGVTLDVNGRVAKLNLYLNQLSGNIPGEIGNLTSLNRLSLGRNKLSGTIPAELGNLSSLIRLDLNNNRLSGVIPGDLGNLSKLTDLLLNNNSLSDSISAQLGNLGNLTDLVLSWNKLSGSIPIELGNLNNLTNLDLSWNKLSGNIPKELGNLSNLSKLNLYHNELSGSIPTELSNLGDLTQLILSFNQLNGNIPAELGNMSKLTYLNLDRNQLNGSIPIELGNLKELNSLNLSTNELVGRIPAELGNLSMLTDLYLDSNQLSESIPPQLGNLSKLTFLNSNNNQLSGSIPAQLSTLSSLTKLFLGNNQLSGSIPDQFGNLSNLTSLILGNNQLSGNIPPQLGNLSKLTYLKVSINNLSGILPEFPYTSNLQIDNNNFSCDDLSLNFNTNSQISNFTYSPQIYGSEQAFIANTNTVNSVTLVPTEFPVTLNNPSYQWKKNGNLITGANSTSYALDNVQPSDIGAYKLHIEDDCIPGIEFISESYHVIYPGYNYDGQPEEYDQVDPKLAGSDLENFENGIIILEQNKPNPAKDFTTISYKISNEKTEAINLKIYSITGKLIKQFDLDESRTNSINVSLKDMQPGLYFYTIATNSCKSVTKKMVVKK